MATPSLSAGMGIADVGVSAGTVVALVVAVVSTAKASSAKLLRRNLFMYGFPDIWLFLYFRMNRGVSLHNDSAGMVPNECFFWAGREWAQSGWGTPGFRVARIRSMVSPILL